jgi:hypothetical protein
MKTAPRFADSAEAYAFMVQIQSMLADPRLYEWSVATVENFSSSNAVSLLSQTQQRFEDYLTDLEGAN